MVTRAVLQQAFDVLEFLQSRGVKAIIAGGCARDIFFGVRPKDVDIVVAGATLERVSTLLAEANIAGRTCGFYDCAASDRIIGCVKLANVDIDVVVYDCHDVSEAIDAFDFNLNQFAIVDVRHGIDFANVRFVGQHHWGRLVAVRKDCKPERAARMVDKYLDLVPRRATGEIVNSAPVGGIDGPF
ncbi:TPA: hypothetical protein L4S01_001553 [Pseudomonas aeruginosa]|nr:hypothetical protein [Pseudomonas aeruginosa]